MMNRVPIRLEVGVRFVLRVFLVAAFTAVALCALVLVAPKFVGGQSLSVLSGSMAPVVNTGDMVAIVPQKATDIEPGQIVAFNDPNGSGRLYQHRVQSIEQENDQLIVVTKGDANNSGETWQTPLDSEVGKVVLIVPYVGTVVGHVTSGKPIPVFGREVPLGTLAIAIVMLLIGGILIIGILRSDSKGKNDGPEGEIEVFDYAQQDLYVQQGHIVHHTEEGPTHA